MKLTLKKKKNRKGPYQGLTRVWHRISHGTSGNAEMYDHFRKQWAVKSNIVLPYDLDSWLLGIQPRGMKTDLHTNTCVWMFIAAFVVAWLLSWVWLFAARGLNHTRLPCPSLSLGVCPNSCPLSWWCHPSNHLILCCRLLLLPSIFPISRVFYNELALLTRWPMYWSFSLSIIFRIDFL